MRLACAMISALVSGIALLGFAWALFRSRQKRDLIFMGGLYAFMFLGSLTFALFFGWYLGR